ncbi:MAG: transposase [Thermodesulfobacteriota bacterium]
MQTPLNSCMPEQCQRCAKLSQQFIHGGCDFCQDLGFQEEIFCDLNRCRQDSASFECKAFQPILKLIGAAKSKDLALPRSLQDDSSQKAFRKLLDSDKVKYQRALGLQKIACEPSRVFAEIKYHFAWNVSQRRPAFAQPGDMFDSISNIFANCGERVDCIVSLLWLAPDHLHLYVQSGGEKSADQIAQEIKNFSTPPLLAEFSKLGVSFKGGKSLWDKAYFVETVG